MLHIKTFLTFHPFYIYFLINDFLIKKHIIKVYIKWLKFKKPSTFISINFRGYLFSDTLVARNLKIFAHPVFWKLSRGYNFAHPKYYYTKNRKNDSKMGYFDDEN